MAYEDLLATGGDRVRAIHEDAIVIDAHADIEVPGRESPYVGIDGRSRVAPDKLVQGGVDAVVLSVAVGPGARDDAGYQSARRVADRKLAAVQELVADPSNQMVLARSPDEIIEAKAAGHRSVMLGFQNTQIIGTDIEALDSFYDAGCRVFALNHIGHNDCADSSRPMYSAANGCHEPTEEHGGLSELGRAALRRINDFGGLVDVSQLSKQATLQALDQSDVPVIASHSNVRALCDLSRNLSDEEVDGIAAGGGVVHVAPFLGYLYDTTNQELVAAVREARIEAGLPEDYLYPFELYWELPDPDEQVVFRDRIRDLLGRVTVENLVNHIDYVVALVGIDHVGIGSDFNHGGGIEGFLEAYEAPNVTASLLARGYSSDQVKLIWGENFLRALRSVE